MGGRVGGVGSGWVAKDKIGLIGFRCVVQGRSAEIWVPEICILQDLWVSTMFNRDRCGGVGEVGEVGWGGERLGAGRHAGMARAAGAYR